MRLTNNLSRKEFACKCGCGFDAADMELLKLIQGAGDHFKELYGASDMLILITSGNRCAVHNASSGGAARSKHIYGIAADHRIKVSVNGKVITVPSQELAAYYNELHPNRLGIGIYPNGRVHLDVRTTPARWDNS